MLESFVPQKGFPPPEGIGVLFPPGPSDVTLIVSDACDNRVNCSFSVTNPRKYSRYYNNDSDNNDIHADGDMITMMKIIVMMINEWC